MEFLKNMIKDSLSWVTTSVSIGNILEIILISICLYYIMLWFKRTRAWTLLKGLLIVLGIMLLANIFNMRVISAILSSCFSVGIIALIILFQPELRKALEQLGRKRLLQGMLTFDEDASNMSFSDLSMEEVIDACREMSQKKVGALISFENRTSLGEWEKTGIALDAKISAPLILQIFEKNTPLHDGGVIIREDRVVAATCIFPVSSNMSISRTLGTRHRAALGLSEVTDSLTIIVSEETGGISVSYAGEMDLEINEKQLRQWLMKVQNRPESIKTRNIFKRRVKHEAETKETSVK